MAFIVTNEVSYFKSPIVWVNLWEDFCPNVLIDDRRRFCANDLKIVIKIFEFLLNLVLIIDKKINEIINSNQTFISNIEYIPKLE